jgi:hypothetical protein
MSRLSLETAAVLSLLLGAWVGIVSFVGPVFGFSGDGTSSWQWNLAHAALFFAPGVGAFVAGLLAIVGTMRARPAIIGLAGLFAAACGSWLIVGPVAWPVLKGTAFFRTGVLPIREFAYWIGYALGPGGLLIALGAFILGRDRFRLPQRATRMGDIASDPTGIEAS